MSSFPYSVTATANSKGYYASGYFSFKLTVSLSSQSTSDNTSTLLVDLSLASKRSSSGNVWNYGQLYPSFTLYYSFDNSSWTSFYSATIAKYTSNGGGITDYISQGSSSIIISHDDDGTKTIYVKAVWTKGSNSLTYDPVTTTLETGALSLPAIARAATVSTSTTSFTYGDSLTLSLSSYVSSFTYKLAVGYNSTSSFTNIAAITASSYTYSLSTDVASKLTSSSNYIRFRLYTYNGSTLLGSSDTSNITVTTPSSGFAPTVTISLSDTAGYYSTYGKYVKNKSVIKVTPTITYKYGASLSSISITNGTTTSSASSASFSYTSTSTTYKVTVKDSRGQTTTASVTAGGYDWYSPTLSIDSCYRSNSSGEADDSSGAYITIVFTYEYASLGSQNSATASISMTPAGGEETTSEVSLSSTGSTLTVIYSADINCAYSVSVQVSDRLGSSSSLSASIGSIEKAITINKNNGVAIGKIHDGTEDTFQVGWPSIFDDSVEISNANSGNIVLNTLSSDLAIKSTHGTSDNSIAFGVGSGGVNRGIYDSTRGNWLIYRNSADADTVVINGSITGTISNATKLGSSTVGGTAKPIYLSSGSATACSSTVGSGTKPVYMSSGTITASSSTVGSSSNPVYLNSGTITACSTIGTYKSATSSTAKTLSANTETELATLSLDAGVWVLKGTIKYRKYTTASGSTTTSAGYRASAIYVSGSDSVDNARQKNYAGAGITMYCTSSEIVSLTATTTYALGALSTTAVGIAGYSFQAVRIK